MALDERVVEQPEDKVGKLRGALTSSKRGLRRYYGTGVDPSLYLMKKGDTPYTMRMSTSMYIPPARKMPVGNRIGGMDLSLLRRTGSDMPISRFFRKRG